MTFVPVVAGAAARRRRLLLEKEEEMTHYTQGDLDGEWEFKIVRSPSAAFHDQEAFEKLIEEEARASWVMLEKLDDRRVRFKRLRSARAKDAYLPPGVDPYRTSCGMRASQQVALALVVAGLALLLLAGILAFLVLFLLRPWL